MRGHTLLELTAVLALVGAAASILTPTARAYRDRTAVVSAREAVVGLLGEARAAALRSGGGEVEITGRPWRAATVERDSVISAVGIESEFGVELLLGRGRDSTRISYGPLGLGRFASETVRFRRGAAETRLVISAYGRIRRD